MSRRVAVTGASGFIGRHVTASLAARGDLIVPIARPFARDRLAAAFRDVDAVVHLAGVVSATRVADFVAANVDATQIVADAARTAGTHLVHISSLAAAGPAPPTAPRREDDLPRPITPYGRSKLAGETIVSSAAGLRWTVLRPGVVYGPGDRGVLPLFHYAARGLLPLTGRSDAAYTFIYIDDAVRAITAAIDRGPLQTPIFLGHATPVTPRQLLEQIRRVVGRGTIVRVPLFLTRVGAVAGDIAGAVTGRPVTINRWRFAELASEGFVCRVDRLRDDLGVVADVELPDGVQRAAEWYCANGWIR